MKSCTIFCNFTLVDGQNPLQILIPKEDISDTTSTVQSLVQQGRTYFTERLVGVQVISR